MNYLDTVGAIDWSDMSKVETSNRSVLENIAGDPDMLSGLIENARSDQRLLDMCESHAPFDKIVLYDAPDRGFRIRLHLWREAQAERVHQHRFPITILVLRGSYKHIIYNAKKEILADEASMRKHMDPESPMASLKVVEGDVYPILATEVRQGDSYTLHHDALHATFPAAGCVSLCMRGPTMSAQSLVYDRSSNHVYWRFGREDEGQERIEQKRMRDAAFDEARQMLVA